MYLLNSESYSSLLRHATICEPLITGLLFPVRLISGLPINRFVKLVKLVGTEKSQCMLLRCKVAVLLQERGLLLTAW